MGEGPYKKDRRWADGWRIDREAVLGSVWERDLRNRTEVWRILHSIAYGTTIRIIDIMGTHDISIKEGTYPFVYYNELLPSEYYFLDAEGNEVP